jgi:hypothetical protein
MAIEFLIGEFPGDADETVALVNTSTGVPLPVHTFRSVEAAESFVQYCVKYGIKLNAPPAVLADGIQAQWAVWWDECGKDLP